MKDQSAVSRGSFVSRPFIVGLTVLGVLLPISLVAVEVVVCGLLLLTVLRLLRGKLCPSRWDLPILCFIIIRLITGIFSQHNELTLKGLIYLSFALSYCITAWNPEGSDVKVWRNFIRALVIGATAASVCGIIQFASGAVRVEGFYGGWTVFGSMTGAALISGIYLTARGDLFFRRSFDLLLLTLCAAGLAVSLCRAEWVAVFIVLLPAGILFYPKYSAILLSITLALFLLVTPMREKLFTLFDPLSNLSGRDIIWKPAINLIAEKPILGHGLNSFQSVFPQELRSSMTDPGAGDWHNVYLQVAVESGLLGLAAFLWMLASFLYLFLRQIRLASTDQELGIAWGLFALIAFFCIAGGFGVFLVRIPVVMLFFLSLGRISHLHAVKRIEP